MKFSFSLILLLSFLVFCTTSQERALEATLTFAGTNSAELEKVLHHYKDEPLKQAAARFLIAHMKDRRHYRSAGIDSIRHYLTVATKQESCLPLMWNRNGVHTTINKKNLFMMYRYLPPII